MRWHGLASAGQGASGPVGEPKSPAGDSKLRSRVIVRARNGNDPDYGSSWPARNAHGRLCGHECRPSGACIFVVGGKCGLGRALLLRHPLSRICAFRYSKRSSSDIQPLSLIRQAVGSAPDTSASSSRASLRARSGSSSITEINRCGRPWLSRSLLTRPPAPSAVDIDALGNYRSNCEGKRALSVGRWLT